MFHAHVTLIAIKTINWKERVDPNDLYDAIQLLLLTDGRLFASNEKNFLRHTKDSYVQAFFLGKHSRSFLPSSDENSCGDAELGVRPP